ncbi:MAG: Gfo/Idh/MocA family oxidoreductase [Bryobacterales bacterium]|nr:Gfo/Idh/MocA family oxidoreductase [Bryobacterales bacterium]
MQRRDFVRVAAGFPAIARNGWSANGRIRVAMAGLGSRGRDLMRSFHLLRGENVEMAALVDTDEAVLSGRAADFEKLAGRRPAAFRDIGRLLEDPSIDAIVLATPTHRHARGAIQACQAGKDVYVEAPGSGDPREGRELIEAVQRYRRIVQHGTQSRSNPATAQAVRKLQEGQIGRVFLARAIVPGAITAETAGRGVHQLDVIRWALNRNTPPARVAAMGAGQSRSVLYEWAGCGVLVILESRGADVGFPSGVIFAGTEGSMILSASGGYRTLLGAGKRRGPAGSGAGEIATLLHVRNFIRAMRSRNPADLNAGPRELHLSSALPCLAVAACTGRPEA